MEFQEKEIIEYIESHTTEEDSLLFQLRRETHLNVLMPGMISGGYQGKLLQFIAQMMTPRRVLEIGTFTGYSAICLGRGLAQDGLLYTIDVNDELKERALKFLEKAGLKNRVKLLIGNALEIIPTLEETFDLVFIDADKENYSRYFELVIGKMKKGAFIIADNVLWKGKVLDASAQDKKTTAMREFNRLVQESPEVENIMLPIRDGLLIARKTS